MPHELYHRTLVDAARAAVGAGHLAEPDGRATVDNPLCGDRVTVELCLRGDEVTALAHEVRGCILCEAAASMLGARAEHAGTAALRRVAADLEAMIRAEAPVPDDWPELAAFTPVRAYKSRHRCVLLPFEALVKALDAAESL